MKTNIFLNIAKIYFNCPFCGEKHKDTKDKYLNRCNKNKSNYTKIKCKCGKYFGFTYDQKGNAVAFELKINAKYVV